MDIYFLLERRNMSSNQLWAPWSQLLCQCPSACQARWTWPVNKVSNVNLSRLNLTRLSLASLTEKTWPQKWRRRSPSTQLPSQTLQFGNGGWAIFWSIIIHTFWWGIQVIQVNTSCWENTYEPTSLGQDLTIISLFSHLSSDKWTSFLQITIRAHGWTSTARRQVTSLDCKH